MRTPDVVEPNGSGFARANAEAARLAGRPLVAVRTENRLHLEFAEGYHVTIETPFEVITADTRWVGEPATPESARALHPVVGAVVLSARVTSDAALHLTIGDVVITVGPNDCYEAWQLWGPRDLLVVCAPGGEYVAVFAPDTQA